MSFNYKNPVCKGSWQIGNNCKTCERCVETDPNKPKELPRSTVWVMDYGILGRILFATKEQALAINKTASTYVEPYEVPVLGSKPDMTDAYNGAREEVEIWKKRALEAEAKLTTTNFESNFWKQKTLDAETKVALLTKELDQETLDTLYRKMTENPITVRYSSYHWFMSGAVIAQQLSKTFADESLAAISKS